MISGMSCVTIKTSAVHKWRVYCVALFDFHRHFVALFAQRVVRRRQQMLVLPAMNVVTARAVSTPEGLMHFLLCEIRRQLVVTLQTQIALGLRQEFVGVRSVRIMATPTLAKFHSRVSDRTVHRLRNVVVAL